MHNKNYVHKASSHILLCCVLIQPLSDMGMWTTQVTYVTECVDLKPTVSKILICLLCIPSILFLIIHYICMLQNNQCKEQSSFVSAPLMMSHALTTIISTANMGISTAWITLHYTDEDRIFYSNFHPHPPPKKKCVLLVWTMCKVSSFCTVTFRNKN